MPFVPILDTGVGKHARIVSPPSMETSGAICTLKDGIWPGDVVIVQGLNPWRNGSL